MRRPRLLLLLLLAATPTLATLPVINLYTVADGGGDDGQDCSRAHPCATIEAACAMVPAALKRPYVIHVGGGTYSAGCHLVGLHQEPGDDWSSPGSVTVDCALDAYADGGTGEFTLGGVTAGSNGTRDVWVVDAGGFDSDSLKGWQVEVVRGTGSAPQRWPITTNTATNLTIGGVSTTIGPTMAPAAGSVVQLWTRGVTINGVLADTVAPVGFPPVTPVGAAFVVNVQKGLGNDAVSPVARIRGCRFGSGAARGVLFSGPVELDENECATTTSSCFRGMDGINWPVAQRNIISGSSTFMVLGNTANGSFSPEVQLYNNFSTGTVGNLLGAGQIGQFLSGMNEVTTSSETIRVNSILDGVSRYDKLTSAVSCLRSPLTPSATDIGSGVKLDFVGLTCTGTGTYDFTLDGRGNRVQLDAASTDTASNHHAALAHDAQFWWLSGATLNGAGSDDVAFTDTGGSLTEAGCTGGVTAKYQCNDHGACCGIPGHVGNIYAPVVAPVGSTSGADGQLQLCSGAATATNGASSVTFASAARCGAFSATPACSCAELGDGGTPSVPCMPQTVSSAVVTFIGDTHFGAHTHYWQCSGPK